MRIRSWQSSRTRSIRLHADGILRELIPHLRMFMKFLFRFPVESISFSYGQRMHLSHRGRHFGRRWAKGTMLVEFGSRDWRDRWCGSGSCSCFALPSRERPRTRWLLLRGRPTESLGIGWKRAKPGFFVKTNIEVSNAILALQDGEDRTVLRKHLAQIDDLHLRRAFRAAVGLHDASETRAGTGTAAKAPGPVERPVDKMNCVAVLYENPFLL